MFHVSSTKDQCLFQSQGQGYDVGVIAKAGIFFWGSCRAPRILFGSVADIPNVEADPRRKPPGGQSSPQSLRGIASIVCGLRESEDDLSAHGCICCTAYCAIARNWALRP
jgi:hypothetical protein